jgi:2-keto-myo-inositol isomerase
MPSRFPAKRRSCFLLSFALNHMAAPRLGTRDFLDLAASLGCVGVELRNDLADKNLADRAFFDGESPAAIGEYARSRGLRLLGLSEAYGFNNWSEAMRHKVETLVSQAKASGAETISLIPDNSGNHGTDTIRLAKLRQALAEILPLLKAANLIALVEPLGFGTSSLRRKSEAVEAIETVGGRDHFKLVHDTFHHHLAADPDYFPAHTGIVHISGVADRALDVDDMRDEHRGLVDGNDRLGNVDQITQLVAQGYDGAYSFEPFSPQVHGLTDPEGEFGQSIEFIRHAVSTLKQSERAIA